MRVPGLARLQRTTKRLRNRFTPKVLILLYHRVAELPSDPYLLSVTPQHFAEHLEVLQQHGVMPLQQLIQAVQNGNMPSQGIVVTFDDGYADNLYNAKPLLEHYDIPATVFVSSGCIGQKREFWWDELDRLLLQPGTLPATLHLNINGTNYQWELGEVADYSVDNALRDRGWHLYQPDDPSLRHQLFRSLHQLLNALSPTERWQVLDELCVWAGVETTGRATHRMLLPAEVAQLAEDKLVEVGAHTVTHPVLSELPIAVQRHEIQQSKTDLEAILGHAVTSFAYPHGRRSDFTAETIAIAQETGFTCACTTVLDLVRRSTNYFQLPRATVQDCDGETFAQRLEGWLYS